MKSLNRKQFYLVIGIIVFATFSGKGFGQMFTGGLTVEPSDLLKVLAEKKVANPKLSALELSDLANELLNKKGLNHEIELDSRTCAIIAAKRKTLKPGSTAVGGRIAMKAKDGNATNVFVPNFESASCGRCFAPMPLIAATEKELIVTIQGINVGFLRASNLVLNEVVLIDQKDATKSVRRWAIPARSVPLGFSDDGLWLYIELPEKGFEQLALMIYETGVIQFAPRDTLDLREKGVEPKNTADQNNAAVKSLTFGSGENSKTIDLLHKLFDNQSVFAHQ